MEGFLLDKDTFQLPQGEARFLDFLILEEDGRPMDLSAASQIIAELFVANVSQKTFSQVAINASYGVVVLDSLNSGVLRVRIDRSDSLTFTPGAAKVQLIIEFPDASFANGKRYENREFQIGRIVAGNTLSLESTLPPGILPISDLAAVEGDAQVSLAWNAPGVSGDAVISDYIIQFKESSSSDWDVFDDGTGSSLLTTATVTGLTNGTPYDFRIVAVDNIGLYTSFSNVVSSTPAASPLDPSIDAIADLAAVGGTNSGELDLTWTAPAVNDGAVVSEYIIQAKESLLTDWDVVGSVEGTDPTLTTLTGLNPAVSYDVRIIAVDNALGLSSFSNIASATTTA